MARQVHNRQSVETLSSHYLPSGGRSREGVSIACASCWLVHCVATQINYSQPFPRQKRKGKTECKCTKTDLNSTTRSPSCRRMEGTKLATTTPGRVCSAEVGPIFLTNARVGGMSTQLKKLTSKNQHLVTTKEAQKTGFCGMGFVDRAGTEKK